MPLRKAPAAIGRHLLTALALLSAAASQAQLEFVPVAALNDNAATDSGGDPDPRVATDGVGNWVAVWWSWEDLGGTIGTDVDILVSRSSDGGKTWTSPAVLNSNASSDSDLDWLPDVAADGAGNWVAVWESQDDLSGTIGSDGDILVSRSSDAGATWTPAVALNTNAATDSGTDRTVRVAADGAGSWVALWNSVDDLGGTIGTDSDILVSRSIDAGVTWTAPAALHSNAGTDSQNDLYPAVTGDGAGNWVALWESLEDLGGIGTDKDIFVARSIDGGATWTGPDHLNGTAGGPDERPQIATDRNGNWVAVWHSGDNLGSTIGTDSDILVSRSVDAGASWSAPIAANSNAATDSGSDFDPWLATDAAGSWLVIWMSDEDLGGTIGTDNDILFARSSDTGATWSAPEALNSTAASDAANDTSAVVTTDGSGSWAALWDSNNDLGATIGTDFDILFTTAFGPDTDADGLTDGAEVNFQATDPDDADSDDDDASDGNEALLGSDPNDGMSKALVMALSSNAATDSGADSWPHLATDGAGNWVAAWYSDDTLGATIGSDEDILFARSTDAGANWSTVAALNSTAATGSFDDRFPHVANDGAGNWVAVWESMEPFVGQAIEADLDSLVSRSIDGGQSWSAAAVLNSGANSDSRIDSRTRLATDGAGNWVAVWTSQDVLGGPLGTDRDLLVSQSTDAGVSWSASQALNTNASTDAGTDSSVHVATDGAGNWVAAWQSTDSLGATIGTDPDILVALSTDAGGSWTAPVALNTNAATDSGADSWPHLATDGAGNWTAVWYSDDDLGGTIGTDEDILVARSTDAGATWTAPAALNTNAATDSGGDRLPQTMLDDAGDWVTMWDSGEDVGAAIGTDLDILFARSRDAGATWSAPQALNTNAATDSGFDAVPVLATDGDGNWVMAWYSEDTLGATIGSDWDILFTSGTGPDRDADGLADAAEVNVHGTAPLDSDSDDDGLTDGAEVALGTAPLDADTDDDGLTDGGEVALGTTPLDPDSDGDAWCDGPLNPGGACTSGVSDNCPVRANGGQENSDTASAGDLCQCGGVVGSDGIDAVDVQAVRQHIVGATPHPSFELDACDVTDDQACNLLDAFTIARIAAGASAPVDDTCPIYFGPP